MSCQGFVSIAQHGGFQKLEVPQKWNGENNGLNPIF